jgi:hypothetical protein
VAKGGACGRHQERPTLPRLSEDRSQTAAQKSSPSEEEPRQEAAHSRKNSEPGNSSGAEKETAREKVRTASALLGSTLSRRLRCAVGKSEPQRRDSKKVNPGPELARRKPKSEPAGAAETQHNENKNGGGALRDGFSETETLAPGLARPSGALREIAQDAE